MAFRLKKNESVGKGVRRLVVRQLGRAARELREAGTDDENVHQARKRFKRIRALIRLVRDELGNRVYRQENAFFRDAARPLTELRDARVLLDTIDKLAQGEKSRVFAVVRAHLQVRHESVRRRVFEETNAVESVLKAIAEAQGRVKKWHFAHRGWKAVRGGLKRVCKAGHRVFAAAAADAKVENLHEWRKQAKYLWHQVQVFESVCPEELKKVADSLHDLTKFLGDDHDLAVLQETLAAEGKSLKSGAELKKIAALTERRRGELQREAFQLGRCLYGEKPGAFAGRLHEYWKKWRSD